MFYTCYLLIALLQDITCNDEIMITDYEIGCMRPYNICGIVVQTDKL
jgi:hypothetical protein